MTTTLMAVMGCSASPTPIPLPISTLIPSPTSTPHPPTPPPVEPTAPPRETPAPPVRRGVQMYPVNYCGIHYAGHMHAPYDTVELAREMDDVLEQMARVGLTADLDTDQEDPALRVAPRPDRRVLFVASHTEWGAGTGLGRRGDVGLTGMCYTEWRESNSNVPVRLRQEMNCR